MDNSIESPGLLKIESLQWIKGDKIGSVEQIATQEGEWTIFHSGARIATNLINEFMIPIEGEPLDLNPVQAIPNGPIATNGPASQPPSERIVNKQKDNPIKTLFDKQKKTDSIDLKLTFSINVPSKDIFDIISMTFDEDEVINELNSFISNQINPDVLKDTLKTSIEELIKKRFNINP
jgi:hypothetical protein